MSSYLNPWQFNGKDYEIISGEFASFVYLITHIETGKKYIGKKQFFSTRTKLLKGKKKKTTVESDWKTYYGSNNTLKKDIGTYGTMAFKREILRLCPSKSEATYYEAKYQFATDAIISDEYYNDLMFLRVNRIHLKNLTNKKKLDIVIASTQEKEFDHGI